MGSTHLRILAQTKNYDFKSHYQSFRESCVCVGLHVPADVPVGYVIDFWGLMRVSARPCLPTALCPEYSALCMGGTLGHSATGGTRRAFGSPANGEVP